MALAFYERKIYRGITAADFNGLQGAKILAEPADLFSNAWPNTIYCYVTECLGELPAPMRSMGNNPGYWFEALAKMAIKFEGKKIITALRTPFTFKSKEAKTFAINQQEEDMARKARVKKETASKRKHLDKSLKLKKELEENPRRKGTHGYKSWEKIENGMTVAEYLQKGGRMNDLQWEVKKGNVKLS